MRGAGGGWRWGGWGYLAMRLGMERGLGTGRGAGVGSYGPLAIPEQLRQPGGMCDWHLALLCLRGNAVSVDSGAEERCVTMACRHT